MKIKNDLVRIKIGNKKYDFNNLILDTYLNKFVIAQLDEISSTSILKDRKLRYCLLKFDTSFENLQGDTDLHNQDFDICLMVECKHNQSISEKQVIVQYDYEINQDSTIWDYAKNTSNEIKINDYCGKKITAIGFNVIWANDANSSTKYPVCSVLDTSNYNIYLQENQDLSITRRDIITTEAIFSCGNKQKVPGPVHLAPYGVPQLINQPNIYSSSGTNWRSFNDPGDSILYSVGLSSSVDYIDKEFVIGEDIEIETNGNELIIKGIENYLQTGSSLFCSENIYPNSNLYPTKENYKYVIFKYKIWQTVHSGTYENVTSTYTDTGYYYYQAISIDKFGKMNLKIKYERG